MLRIEQNIYRNPYTSRSANNVSFKRQRADANTIRMSDPLTRDAFVRSGREALKPDFTLGETSLAGLIRDRVGRLLDLVDGSKKIRNKVREAVDHPETFDPDALLEELTVEVNSEYDPGFEERIHLY